ncbi:MAG: 30S ribosomal protein S18 [Rickettsiales bacterium]|jgi:small subunit ribosomal protein S18|nr:30S ribosomal protein S18 [Rickettsiales bacterium]MEC8876421.1 30S ribosomal protein S18 [Pseudomonadota bacterium]HAE75620.1 30S ribosomal protein S18 [Alphaproteobacteria bacterium]MBC36557.1 30S ribosomal protein S18 [Rickettsiales bacterium]MED5339344.1 30S ribosomal protein S18 [Pseudomonadota bacterium]|tara:strand:- start:2007 stop:2276 length:270 start_codon:yes stop_codon:yes gene_type:complete
MKKNRKRTNSRNNTDGRSARNRNTYQRSTSCPLSLPGAPKIDYKNIELLKNYISERGKIMPSRVTYVSPKKQRELAIAIKRARFLALLP